jgi:predicted SAM-dependent methyltransferase
VNQLLKLNVGCGADYRRGFVNIDGSTSLSRVDKVINIPGEPLLDAYHPLSCEYILAQDVVEHLFRWEAVGLMKDFYSLLAHDGALQIRVPDAEYIIRSWPISLQKKITLLYGGQDVPQGGPAEMEDSRRSMPELFCHKYGCSRQSLSSELISLGFQILENKRVGTNFVIKARKCF